MNETIGKWKLFRSRLAVCGVVMSLLILILSLVGPFLAPYGPSEFSDQLLRPPSRNHYFGTDGHGRDVLSRILGGSRITLLLSLTTVLISGLVGTFWGLLAAYTKGVVSTLLSRSMDVLMSFPAIMLALFVIAIVRTEGGLPLIIAISFAYIPRFARVIYGSTLPILEEDFILAEKALGAGHLRILLGHVLPNLAAPITLMMSIYMPYSIMLESTLSFLGLGAPPDVPTWGRIISDGKAYMNVAPWLTIFPGITIIFAALSFNLLGDGLRDVFDPKSKGRLLSGS
jgi:peptide/nickel transport system permease protein